MTEPTRTIDQTRQHLIAVALTNRATKADRSLALHIIADSRDIFTGPELINMATRILHPLSGLEVQARFGRVMAVMTCRDDFVDRVAHGKLTAAEAVNEGRDLSASLDAAFANCFRDFHCWGRGV